MDRKFTQTELEEAFPVLFGEVTKTFHNNAQIDNWPRALWLFSSIMMFAAFLIYLTIVLTKPNADIWDVVLVNGTGILTVSSFFLFLFGDEDTSSKHYLERKYLHLVEDTEAYDLLLEALNNRKKGVVRGLGGKKKTEEYLRKLWITAFDEARLLVAEPILGKPAEQPIADRVREHLQLHDQAREQAIDEVYNRSPEVTDDLHQQN